MATNVGVHAFSLSCLIILFSFILQASSWTRQIYRAPSLHQGLKIPRRGSGAPRRIPQDSDVIREIRREENMMQTSTTDNRANQTSQPKGAERRVGRDRQQRAQALRMPQNIRNIQHTFQNRGNARNNPHNRNRLHSDAQITRNRPEDSQNIQHGQQNRRNPNDGTRMRPQSLRRGQISRSPFVSFRNSFSRFISRQSPTALTQAEDLREDERTQSSNPQSNRKARNQNQQKRQRHDETQRNTSLGNGHQVRKNSLNIAQHLSTQPFAYRGIFSLDKSHFSGANSITDNTDKPRGDKVINQYVFPTHNKDYAEKQENKQNEHKVQENGQSEDKKSRDERKRQILQYLEKAMEAQRNDHRRGNANTPMKSVDINKKDHDQRMQQQLHQKRNIKQKLHQNSRHQEEQRHHPKEDSEQQQQQQQPKQKQSPKQDKEQQNPEIQQNNKEQQPREDKKKSKQQQQPKRLSELMLAIQPGSYPSPGHSHVPQPDVPPQRRPQTGKREGPLRKHYWQVQFPRPPLNNIPARGLGSPNNQTPRNQTPRNQTPRNQSPRNQASRNHASRSILPECDPRTCQPPDCTCASYTHPGNFPVTKVPMMVMLTFDDAVTSWNFPYFQQIMNSGFSNPNGCPIKMTFFVCEDGNNDYSLTRRLYSRGHEIASHSQSHRFPESWWAEDADEDDYLEEFVGQRQKLSELAGIPEWDIKGLRTPFLSINGDNMMNIARDYDFAYDSSCVSTHPVGYGRSVLWPYTLDYAPNSAMCEQETRPTESFPGIWEVPLTKYSCDDRVESSRGNYMLDECRGRIGNNSTDVVNFLWRHFNHHYTTRAPMGLFTHATFLRGQPGALPGLLAFLQGLTKMQDVWIISVSQMLDWMKSPTPLDSMSRLSSWNC